jgi:ornithine--oxo-acid transaminase
MEHKDFWERIRTEGVQQIVSSLNSHQTEDLTARYGTHNYHPLPVTIVRTEGTHVFDADGREYIDCIGSYSAVAFGHLSPFIVETVRQQLGVSALTSRAVYAPELALFLEGLSFFTGLDMVCPMNNIKPDLAEIVVADSNFHGRTTTIVGFSSEQAYKNDFGPFTPGFITVPFGDPDAVKFSFNSNTAAVMLEPIQAEAGILIPPEGYLAAVRKLCSDENVLLIWDEIQTGFGRTGKTFAWQYEDARPDMICLGKALGGGIIPVSAVAGAREVMEVFHPGDHGSTFGGSPLACAAALAAMAEMEVQNLAERSRVNGERLRQKLSELEHPSIVDVRGRRLLIGLEVSPDVESAQLTEAFLNSGILTKETRRHTFRFAPPLTINEDTVDEIVLRVKKAFGYV